MALAFQREQVGVKFTGQKCTVPNNPKARLMYYLNCMSTILKLDELPAVFTNYTNYYALDEKLANDLMELCKILSPDKLEGKCIFETADLSGECDNEFVELSSAKTTMVATSSIMMAGRNIKIAKIMMYMPSWRRRNYDQPMAQLARSLAPPPAITSSRSTRRRSSSCILL